MKKMLLAITGIKPTDMARNPKFNHLGQTTLHLKGGSYVLNLFNLAAVV